MKTEIELPPLPDGWADGPVEIRYGSPPIGSIVLTSIGWDNSTGSTVPFVHAVRKWQPAIVQSGLLEPGWIVIEECGDWYNSTARPRWCEDSHEWGDADLHCLFARETPQVTGETAIWEIK